MIHNDRTAALREVAHDLEAVRAYMRQLHLLWAQGVRPPGSETTQDAITTLVNAVEQLATVVKEMA